MQEKTRPTVDLYNRYYRKITETVTRPRTRAYTMIVFSLLAISLFVWFAIRPTIQTILYLRKEIEDKTFVNKKMDEKIASLIQAQADYNNLRPRLSVLANALPEDPEAISFVTELRNIATNTNVAISSLHFTNVPLSNESIASNSGTPDGSSNEPAADRPDGVTVPVDTMTVTGNFAGSYENVRAYLAAIKTMRRIISVQLLKIDSGTGVTGNSSGSGNLLQLNLQLNAYYVTGM